MEALYYAVFYSICTTAWLAVVGFAIHTIDYGLTSSNHQLSNYRVVVQFRFMRLFLITIVSGACIGLTVLATANGLSGDHILAQLFIASIAGYVYKKWVLEPPTEDEYKDVLTHRFQLQAKTDAIQSVLGVIGGMQTNGVDGDGTPYRSSDTVLDHLVEYFKNELEKVRKGQ